MLVEQMVFHCSITVLETIKIIFTISMFFSKVLVPVEQNNIHKVRKVCFICVPEVCSLEPVRSEVKASKFFQAQRFAFYVHRAVLGEDANIYEVGEVKKTV